MLLRPFGRTVWILCGLLAAGAFGGLGLAREPQPGDKAPKPDAAPPGPQPRMEDLFQDLRGLNEEQMRHVRDAFDFMRQDMQRSREQLRRMLE